MGWKHSTGQWNCHHIILLYQLQWMQNFDWKVAELRFFPKIMVDHALLRINYFQLDEPSNSNNCIKKTKIQEKNYPNYTEDIDFIRMKWKCDNFIFFVHLLGYIHLIAFNATIFHSFSVNCQSSGRAVALWLTSTIIMTCFAIRGIDIGY